MRRLAPLLVLIGLVSVASPAGAASPDPCSAAFPEVAWEPVAAEGVAVFATGVPAAQETRFGGEISIAAGWIQSEMGTVDGTVCLVAPGSGFDDGRFATGSQRFHAVLLADRAIVAISTEELGRVGAAATFGLAHLRLWQESGGAGWPEPLATAIAHWYRARLLDRIDYRHADARAGNFFTTTSQIDWAAGRQTAILDWDPKTNDSAIGDLIDHAVAEEGTGVLLDPDPAHWATREAAWRTSLRTELSGSSEPTTVWKAGIAIAIAVLVIALISATLGFWSKRRNARKRPTPEPLPGFFSESRSTTAAGSPGERG